ncbi:MAG: transcriptional regulator [Haloquadratum walsbyi J07HQW1]|uniref:Transcriptional regulator n=1 Tax=Haloquadratum walsbyi J07HQW1 TaxID=1238424 RepID=U1MST8_9EURY|nr:MAG: transcriptional regulator [Haloquadratum walsbyi J07HQW1]
MVHAFIMMKTDATDVNSLLDSITDVNNVTDAHIVAGSYDIIIEADAEEVYDLLNPVASGIRGTEGVIDTKTYIAIDGDDRGPEQAVTADADGI